MQTIKINNRKELDALAKIEPEVLRMAETMRSLERYPLTLVLGNGYADFEVYGLDLVSKPTVTDNAGRHWLHTPSIVSDDELSCGYRVGLVSAPIDPNCKVGDDWQTRTPAEIVEDIQDDFEAFYNLPVRMLTGEYKTRLDVGGTAAWDNHQLHHSARFTAALDKVRKAKNHGPRGKWGKLK